MRLILVMCTMGLLTIGCSTSRLQGQHNPFQKFAASDIDKVLICCEEENHGTDTSPEFGLKPSGAAIRDKTTIASLHQAMFSSAIGTGYPKTGSGILSYQVFLDAKNRILAVTSIENYQCNVSIRECSMTDGVIRFNEDMSFRGCQNKVFCRTVYDFMKKEMPDTSASWEESFKKLGGLEKLLFGGVE